MMKQDMFGKMMIKRQEMTSLKFQGWKPEVSRQETLSFKAGNSEFQGRRKYSSHSDWFCSLLILFVMMVVGAGKIWSQPFTVTTDPNNPNYYLLQNVGTPSFYAVPYTNDDETFISTSNVPNSDMRFYFVSVENEAGYYYIIHSSGKYLYAMGNANVDGGARLKASATTPTENRYKFSIEQNGGGYYIINKELGSSAPLCKRGGNTMIGRKDNSNPNYYFLKLNTYKDKNGNRDDYFRWNFIPISDTTPIAWTAPFTFSTDESRSYYKINNAKSNSFYISRNTSTNKVNTSSTGSNDMVWYFKEVPSGENGSGTYITYYYIIHAITGKYMCFDGDPSKYNQNQSDAVSLQEKTTVNEENCQFIITGSSVSGSRYNIVPKALKSYIWNNQSIGQKDTNEGTNVWTKTDRADDNSARWFFGDPIEYTNVCATPVISYDNSTGLVTITSDPADAAIHYTIDGTTIPSSTVGSLYSASFSITEETTIKAIATKDGVTSSLVATASITQVAQPTLLNDGTNITISSTTDGADKYYSTDGGTSYTLYTTPLLVEDYEGQTITAIAKKDGCINSETNTLTVTATCKLPTITLNYQTGEVTIASTTEGATIYYTIDGTDPDNNSNEYSTLILTEGKTVKAIAYKVGTNPSSIASETYSQVATPSIEKISNAISMSCTTDGAEIHYTVGSSAANVPDDPNYSSTVYSTSLTDNVSNRTVKARAFKDGMVPSAVAQNKLKLKCNTPTITKDSENMKVFIGCDFPGGSVVTIYYSKDNPIDEDSPTSGTTPYNSTTGISFTESEVDNGFTVYAIATHSDYDNSDVASKQITKDLSGGGTSENDPYIINEGEYSLFVAKANENPGAYYKLMTDIVGGSEKITTPFTGTLFGVAKADGTFPTISGLNHALFDKIDGGTVKNIILNVSFLSTNTGNAGAIANEVTGTSTKKASIYNCGVFGSVTGTVDVGSLVGRLGSTTDNDKCYARVVNCYSFATVSGGTNIGGIVGNNCYGSTSGDIRSMVMNCMFYGTGEGICPIYGGTEISNEADSKLNNYNYFSYEKLPTSNISSYNRALAAEDRYLKRFEFYRYLLNSNRELAAGYAIGDPTKGKGVNNEMAKWVYDRSIAEYPILKKQGTYPSVVNYDELYTYYSETEPKKLRTDIGSDEQYRNKGRNLGELTVTINGVGSNAPDGAYLYKTDDNDNIIAGSVDKRELKLQRTDKDYDDYNFNYDKVQLPYYNDYGAGNYTRYKVVTGWIITDMEGGTKGSFSTSYDAPGYNFADRSTYAKDIYDATNNPRVFSQGAYFDVPDGVTEITIKPYWGNAAYVTDEYYDCHGYGTGNGVEDFGTRYTIGSDNSINGSSQKVYKTINDALADTHLSGSIVYDNAVVLVGNYHQQGTKDLSYSKPFTMMSIDLDKDNEPDYGMIINSGKNESIPQIRFDFINVPGVAMAHKLTYDKNSTSAMGILGNSTPRGWFEVTNTAVIRFSQFEYDWGSKSLAPLILLGGVVEQIVSTNLNGTNPTSHTKYIHVGSNVWFKLFNNGVHMDKQHATPHRPISVTGGEYESFYLSGYFRPDANVYTTADGGKNAECYISGGKFGEVAGAGQEQIAGDVTWVIDQADMDSFYGGGINDKMPILGDINVTVKNSHITQYCGGPKFGNMNDQTTPKKKVTTNASDCTFGSYFGAGFGGTAYVRATAFNKYQTLNYNWNGTSESEKITPKFTESGGAHERGKYDPDKGVSVNYEYETFEGSTVNTVGRLYVNYASLSLARTNDVNSTLTDCTITGNFYGGGSRGKVTGDIVSTLKGCKVKGDVYGAGFSADVPTVRVFDKEGFKTPPHYNEITGVFEPGVYPDEQEYTWSNTEGKTSTTASENNSLVTTTDGEGTHYWIHVDEYDPNTQKGVNLDELGTVTGTVSLTIENSTNNITTVGDFVNSTGGNVYGGGQSSAATNNVEVDIKGNTKVRANVFGGGDLGVVGGNTKVTLQDKVTVSGSVFGGGNKAPVSGSSTVNIKNDD